MYGQQQYLSQAYISMLIEEAEKLYNKIAKELGDEIRSYYAYSMLSSSSIPLLSPSDEKEQQIHPRQTTASNQSYMHTEEPRFIRSEIEE
jgi:hypothetical protein